MFLLASFTAFVMPFALHFMLPALSFLQNTVSAQTPLVAVVETGGNVESFSVPNNIERPLAFGPDGSSYSVASSAYLQKIAPDGATSYIFIKVQPQSHAIESGAIVYADGYLWFQAFEGYIHMKPDGTNITYHQQQFPYPLTVAPNGVYVSLSTGIEFIDGTTYKRTAYPIVYNNVAQFYSVASMTLGKDGRLYFMFTPNGSSVQHLARLDPDGSITFFSPRNVCGAAAGDGIKTLVALSDGIYFVGRDNSGSSLCRTTYTGFFTRLSIAYGHASGSLRPNSSIKSGLGIDGDSDGNIWTTNVIGLGLYSYDTHTSAVAGPYESGILQFLSGYLTVGPDQNVWLYGLYAGNQALYGAYVRHLETFIPTSINLSFVGQSLDFYVSEPVKSAPWTAYSLNPAVATVGPGSFRLGKFKVNAVSAGSTAIVVTDSYGNSRKEPVTVTSS